MSKRVSIIEQLSAIIADLEELKAEPAMILAMVKKRLSAKLEISFTLPTPLRPIHRRKRRTKAEMVASRGNAKPASELEAN